MSKRTVTHQIKLPLSLTIILGLIAFGLIANVLKPVLKIDEAFAAGQVLTKNDMKDVKIVKASTQDAYNRNAFIYDFLSSMRQKMNDPLGQRAKKRKEISQR